MLSQVCELYLKQDLGIEVSTVLHTGFYLSMFMLPGKQGTRLLAEEMLSKYPADHWASDFRLHGHHHHGPAAELTFSGLSLVIQPRVLVSHCSVS